MVARRFSAKSRRPNAHHKEDLAMRKSIVMPAAAVALAVGAWMLMPLRGHEAAAQSAPYIVNAINLDIVPEQFDKFMEVAKENAAASTKDPGCREFNIVVAANDPHHIMFFEVYDNAAALDAHRATDHFKKFQAATKDMVAKRDVRQFMSVAMNMKGM
jgi:quinol monooxygenase YgiN